MNQLYRLYKYLIFTSLIFQISACHKVHKPGQDFSSWKQVSSWAVKGKMSIQSEKNRGSGKFQWVASEASIDAEFTAALGQGSWKIHQDSEGARLTSSENGNLFANNAEELISAELGWHFPWNKLSHWLRGYKSGQRPILHQQLPGLISEDNWSIVYSKWMNTPIGFLPKVITARNAPYTVKVVIYEWNLK